jgi:Protein of unknown function (DUF2911)
MKIQSILLAAAAFGGAIFCEAPAGLAQEQASSVTIDGHAIGVKYTPPSAKNRVTAAFHADADVAFKGVRVPKGDYTVYVLTDSAPWQLAVNKATGAKAAAYDSKLDLGRVNMTMGAAAAAPACKLALTKVAALAAKLEVACNGAAAATTFHLDRGANDSEW